MTIEVKQSAMPSQLMALVRDAMLALTAWAVGKGYIDALTGTHLAGVGMGLATVAWRQYVTHKTHQKLVAAANAAPNDVARVV